MNVIQHTLRAALFLVLAFFGVIMALIFMASTALAIGVLYIVARLQGRPFGVKAYWEERRRPSGLGNPRTPSGRPASRRDPDVVDIEMREIP